VLLDVETPLLGDFYLATLDLGIEEFLYVPALHAYQVIVMSALVQLEHRFAAFEVMAGEQPRLLELGEHAVDGSEPDLHAFAQQELIHVLGRKMPLLAALEEIEDLQPGKRGFQPDGFQVLRGTHGD